MNSEDTNFNLESIKLIICLGNPGLEYARTRHNAGFMFADLLSDKFNTESKFKAEISIVEYIQNKILIAKPSTFMNESGETANLISKFYKYSPENILVIHDDLDINLGQYKLQYNKGPKVHNGILSIEKHLNSSKFWRLRIGIDNRTLEQKEMITGSDYVLGRFSSQEIEILDNTLQEIKSKLFQ